MNEDFIARRIYKLRAKLGISARVMSTSLGQNPSYISQIESKKAMPSIQGLFAICDFFNVSVRDFFDETNADPELLTALNYEILKLDDTELFLLREVAKRFNKGKSKPTDSVG